MKDSEKSTALAVASKNAVSGSFAAMPNYSKYRFSLEPPAKVDSYTKLIPLDDCNKIITELDCALAPAGVEAGTKQAKVLIGSYPAREINDPDTFVRAIASIFAESPPDVGRIAVDQLTRECKWLPTRAECNTICERMITERKAALRIARRHSEEHARRVCGPSRGGVARYSDLSRSERLKFDAVIEKSIKRIAGAKNGE